MDGNASNIIEGFELPPEFWNDYREFIIKKGIRFHKAKFYVYWARQFADFLNPMPLQECSADDVTDFLEKLRNMRSVQDWQVEQAEDALRLLLREYLKVQWAVSGPGNNQTVETESRQSRLSVPSERSACLSENEALEKLRTGIRYRHYSIRTERTYEQWVARFLIFCKNVPFEDLSRKEARQFLDHLAVERDVAAGTQNQALNALVFFFEQVLVRELGEIGEFTRARQPVRLPVVLSKEEVNRLLAALSGTHSLMAGLLYGSGLRLMECVRLRVKDIDFSLGQIMVRNGKGNKDRITILPETYHASLKEHLERVKSMHDRDIETEFISGRRLNASTKMHHVNGFGNMYSLRTSFRSIPGPMK